MATIRVCTAAVLLVVLLVSFLEPTAASVQRITHRETNQVITSYLKPRNYPCMTDWNKLCKKDSDCCSRKCLGTFCKIQGVGVPTTLRPRLQGKLKAKGKGKDSGKGAPVRPFWKKPRLERFKEEKLQ